MKLFVTGFCLVSTLVIAPRLSFSDTLPVTNLSADCDDLWVDVPSDHGVAMYKASVVDAEYKKSQGVLPLVGSIEEYQAYNVLNLPVYRGEQVVNLGHQYAIHLELAVSKDTVVGDFLLDRPFMDMSATLLYKGLAISSAITTAETVSAKTDKDPSLKLVSNFSLENLPLRSFLKSPSILKSPLTDLVMKSAHIPELMDVFGDSAGVVSRVNIECKTTLAWTPTGQRL